MSAGAPEVGGVIGGGRRPDEGVVYRDTHEVAWHQLLRLRAPVSDYVAVLGLVLVVDEAEEYAYLPSRLEDPEQSAIPRLVARRSLSFHVSLLLASPRRAAE
jgi:hypothetical protein